VAAYVGRHDIVKKEACAIYSICKVMAL